MYATTKPAALKASWAPGRAAYGEQYNRMAAAVQAMTGNIGILGGCAEGVGKGWHAESVAYPYDENANIWYASIKSDRWAHCVLNYPNVKREEVGLWPRSDKFDGVIPNIKAIWWHGSDWFNQLTNVNKEIEAAKKLEFIVCQDSTITPSGLWADVLLPIATHFERHGVALPWYKGHYYIHRPKAIAPLGEAKTDFQVFTELAWRLEKLDPALKDFGKRYNPRAGRSYFDNPDAVDEAYLAAWWKDRVQAHQGVTMSWEEFKRRGVYKFELAQPLVAFREQIEQGKPFPDALGQDRDLLDDAGQGHRLDEDPVGLRHSRHPEVDRALRIAQPPAGEDLPLPHDHAASALAHALDLPQHSLAARDLPAGDHVECRRCEAARHPHRRHRRGLERARPHRAAGLRHRALHARRGGGVRGRLDGP